VTISPNAAVTLISADTRQFSATVSNAPSGQDGYTWSVTGSGSFGAGGLYTAPAKVASDETVTVTVTSSFDTSKKASTTVHLKAPIISLAPGDSTIEGGGQLQFNPTVSYVPTGQGGITWELTGSGTIAAWLYSAPSLVSAHQTATVKAILDFDNTKSAQSVLTMDPFTLALSPDTATHYPSESRQFSVVVANHVNKGVTWNLSGLSCGGGACGTLDGNGLYSAPASVSSEFQVDIAATSLADPTKFDTSVVTLKPITVTVSPKTATVKIAATQQFEASVQGGTNTNVIWSVSGTGCAGNACGTIDSNIGLYTAPATAPVPPTVTVTATAVADPSRTDTATVTIVPDPNVKLHGQFAFIYSGWDTSSKTLDAIGSFIADGNGHLTGLIDMNGANGTYRLTNQTFTGTYQVNAGNDLGQMVFNLPTGGRTFRFALSTSGDRGHFLLFESSGMYGSGTFKRQTPGDFSQSSLAGDYAMGMVGLSAMGDERTAIVGRFTVDAAGAVSNTFLDAANTGASPMHFTFGGTLTINAGTGLAFGRGTMPVTPSIGGPPVNFAFYVVDDGEAYLIRTDVIGDNAPPYVGGMMRQVGAPFYNWASGKAVFYMTGILNQTVKKAAVTIGQFDFPSGTYNASAYYTYHSGNSVFTGHTTLGWTVESIGRVYISLMGSSYIGYLVGPNTGFIMQVDDPGSGVMFGFFENETPGPYTNNLLTGQLYGGSVGAALGAVDYDSGIETFDGIGEWNGTSNVTGPSFGLYPDVTVMGTYTFGNPSAYADGFGYWIQSTPSTYNKIYYAISPNRFVMISAEASDVQAAVEIFEK
jgi:hypothetical protein